ncbi:hypothetical protein [Mucilaginibacter auburnensis]|uniref:hypothetical protein n=1 Tax=Mucilaginibacter auburnensis TaxID=1457233 RepID=UPI0012FD8742|nr:hypothetical protein [Mucilaginibacter auburnensis]
MTVAGFTLKEWKLPDLRFPDTCPSDPTWHEFEGVEYTNEAATMDLLLLPIAWGLLCPSQ